MVERKKRGLGRGLGALIPDANSNDRPVDVFFSGGNTEEGKSEGEAKTSRTARTDPAASMQSSRRRKPKAAGTTKSTTTASEKAAEANTAGSKTAAKTTPSKSATSKAGTSNAKQSKAAESNSTSSKSAASKSSAAQTSASDSSRPKTTASKTTTIKPTTSKTAASKTTTSSKSSTAKSGASKNKAGSSTASSTAEQTEKASAATKTRTRKTPPAPASDSAVGGSDDKTTASASSAESKAGQAAADESADVTADQDADTQAAESASTASATRSADEEVHETHPGVYTSSDRHEDHDKAEELRAKEENDTTDVVSLTSVAEEDEVQTAATSSAASQTSAAADSEEEDRSSSATDDASDDHKSQASGDGDLEDYDGVESIPDTEFGEIDVDLIDANPRQPRTVFDEDLLAELVHSIREIGVLQPVVVRQKPSDRSRFELIMGERRLRATKDAGLSTIPAIIRYVEDTDLLRDALLENLHRAELNPLEEAAAYGQLLEDFGCTQEELSERIGRSRPQISNTLRLLRLPPLVQRRVAAGVISAGHARAILGLRDPEHMEVLAQRIVAEGLSVRASEEAVVLLNRGDSINVSRATTKVAPEFLAVAERLGDRLDTKVNISVGKKKGKLSVEFANHEDLDRILSLLGISNEDAL